MRRPEGKEGRNSERKKGLKEKGSRTICTHIETKEQRRHEKSKGPLRVGGRAKL